MTINFSCSIAWTAGNAILNVGERGGKLLFHHVCCRGGDQTAIRFEKMLSALRSFDHRISGIVHKYVCCMHMND